jgi:glycosyltransferase involved in cell wall biosynthesis
MSKQTKGSIGVFLYKYYLGVSVSVVETVRHLASRGFEVLVFIDKASYDAAPIAFDDASIELIIVPKPEPACSSEHVAVKAIQLLKKMILAMFAWQRWQLPSLGCHGSLKTFLDAYTRLFGNYFQVVKRHLAGHRFIALIGVEPLGLIAACHIKEILGEQRLRAIYYNLELLQHTRGAAAGMHILKHMEIICTGKSAITIIPDEQRGRVFQSANNIPAEQIKCLPVGTCGDPVLAKGDYWRNRFPIPDGSSIVLYAGNIQQPWSMTREIVASVPAWPEGCVLVLHTWKENAMQAPYLQEIKRLADKKRVFISSQPVPASMVPELLASADIGLAFYRPIDANFQETGSSSNKLAQYARVGLPVIANDLPSLRRIFECFGNGICVSDPSDLGRAIASILARYEEFRSSAFRSYREHYDLSVHLKKVVQYIVPMPCD